MGFLLIGGLKLGDFQEAFFQGGAFNAQIDQFIILVINVLNDGCNRCTRISGIIKRIAIFYLVCLHSWEGMSICLREYPSLYGQKCAYILLRHAVNSWGVPMAAIFPLSRIATLSDIFSASAMSWVARIMLVPSCCNSRIRSCSSTLDATSNPAVGSSRKTICGLMSDRQDKCNRRCWPIDRLPY